MKIELQKGFTKKLKKTIEPYKFEVGVLEDKGHFKPTRTNRGLFRPAGDLKVFAGGPARKESRKLSKLTNGQILVANMRRLGINLLLAPFKKKNSDLVRFTNAFLRMALAKKDKRRVENLLQAVVRNPILKQEYGPNSALTTKIKGFNRHLIDTGQMFKSIIARATRRV